MNPQDFYTREMAEKGVKFLLDLPDGTKSDEWLLVVGAESARYEKAHREVVKLILDGADPAEQGDRLLSSLIIGWSFDTDCTPESVLEFFQNSKYIKVDVDRFVVKRANFLKKK